MSLDVKLRASFLHAYLSNYQATGVASATATIGFLACAWRTGLPAFYVLALIQPPLHFARLYFLHYPFLRELPQTPERLRVWERRTVGFAGLLFLNMSLGCVVAFVFTQDEFSHLFTICLALGNVLGVVGRSYAMGKLVRAQMLATCVPFAAAMILAQDAGLAILAVFAVPFYFVTIDLTKRLRGDLTGAVREREKARRLASRFEATLEAIPDAVVLVAADGGSKVANSAASLLLPGVDAEDDQPFALLLRSCGTFEEAEIETLERLVRRAINRTGEPAPLAATHLRTRHGMILSARVVDREDATLVIFTDVTEKEMAVAATVEMARKDHLTGLMSRAWFVEQTQILLATATPTSGPCLAVFDLDGFKALNDVLGHHEGDEALRTFAKVVNEHAGPDVIATRQGGDEFAMLCCGDQLRRARFVAAVSTILREFEEIYRNRPVRLTVSVGVTEETGTLEHMFACADQALYAAKHAGKERAGPRRGTVRVFDASMDQERRERDQMRGSLAQAVETGEGIHLVYQPIVNSTVGRIVGAEALCRWTHPELGAIPPATFVALAEELGAIRSLTSLVLRRAIEECHAWPDPMRVSVNLSAIDLQSDDLMERVQGPLKDTGLDPSRLQLEITETQAVRGDARTRQLLDALAAEGIGLALDDFGTGYSNLATVGTLPLTTLKIDRSLLKTIHNERGLSLLSGLIGLFDRLDLNVVVEGIERQEQLDRLTAVAPDVLMQGYLFGRPMPGTQIRAMMERMPQSPAPVDLRTGRLANGT